jgi:fatty acid desaturase
MEESFHQSKKLSREQMKDLMQKNDHPALLRFVLMYALLLASATWMVLSWNQALWQLITAHLFYAIVLCSTFACLHETVHNTAFKSRSMNELAARLCAIPQIYPATVFREFHFTHHRHTHVPGMDPEISLGHKAIPPILSNLPTYMAWITGIPFLMFKCFMTISGALGMPEFLRKQFFPFCKPELRLRLAIECWYILAIYGAIVYCALTISPGFWFIFSGTAFGHCILAMYLLPEHNGLPHEGNIFEKTRSMNTGPFVKFLMWNMPYHAEHHAYPAVPFHALPKLHALVNEEIMHQKEGYPDFHFKVLKRDIKT